MKKFVLFLSLLITLLGVVSIFNIKQNKIKLEDLRIKEEARLKKLDDIKNSFNEYVITNKKTNLYDKENNIVSKVSSGLYLELDSNPNLNKEYFKLKNLDMYINYKDIKKVEKQNNNKRYQNYIPFNKSVVINNTKLYLNDNVYYEIEKYENLPIIINDTDKYYVKFDDKLVYVKKDTKVVDNKINEEFANSIAVLNYHFVISQEEKKLCSPSVICHPEEQFDSHLKYITDSKFYTITMKELEMFIDDKINLPKKSVAITIDDGWFVSRSINLLQKYNQMGTLFLIGSLAPVSDYKSPNLEIHSHSWDMHKPSHCKGGRSPFLCLDKKLLVEDLLKSKQSLNTTYFCYPFFDYNDHAIEALKEAGFTMALAGGNRRVYKGVNKYKVPRYEMSNKTSVNQLKYIIN